MSPADPRAIERIKKERNLEAGLALTARTRIADLGRQIETQTLTALEHEDNVRIARQLLAGLGIKD